MGMTVDDQGQKIVILAREILNAGVPPIPAAHKKPDVTMSFKSLCLATILAAAGGGLVTTFAHEHERPLNIYEKTEMEALVFYTSQLKGMDETALRHEVETKIGIPHFDDMTAGDFSAARRYLQEKAR
jgi:ABC-type sugar transport system substrate-binding protein